MVIGFILMLLWAFLTHYITCGLLCPISFLFGHPWPICFLWTSLAYFLILHSHGLLLTLLGFLNPITLSFILRAHGLSINPLLSYFITSGLLCPILTFLHHIMSIDLLLLFLGSFRPICFPQGPFIFLSPITLSFILKAHGLSINPLLSYFIPLGLLCPILTFLHHIMPIDLLLLFMGSFRPICFPQGPFIYFMGLWSIIPTIRV